MIPLPEVAPDERAAPIRRSQTTAVWSAFTATWHDLDGFEVELRVVVTRGVPRVDGICVQRSNLVTSPPLGSLQLRAFKVPQLLRASLKSSAMTVQKDDSIFDGGFTVSERPGVVIGGPTVKSPGRGRHVDDDFLREVARVYAEARNSGEVVDVAIRNRLAGSGGSAGRWIRQAKDRGFIPE